MVGNLATHRALSPQLAEGSGPRSTRKATEQRRAQAAVLRRKRREAALVVRIVAPAQKRASLRWLIVHETELLILGVCVAPRWLLATHPPFASAGEQGALR